MSKPTINTFGVTQAVFDLWCVINTWLSQYGVNQQMFVDPNNDEQLMIELGSSISEMIDNGIDVYDMPKLQDAWSDWRGENHIVIGPVKTTTAVVALKKHDNQRTVEVVAAPDVTIRLLPAVDNTPARKPVRKTTQHNPLTKFNYNELRQAALQVA